MLFLSSQAVASTSQRGALTGELRVGVGQDYLNNDVCFVNKINKNVDVETKISKGIRFSA